MAALLLVTAPAHAFKRSTAGAGGPCLFWSPPGHSFIIDASGAPNVPLADAAGAIRSSFASWAGVACAHLAFPDLGLSTDPAQRRIGYVPGGNNVNLVLWRSANCGDGAVPAGDPCLTQGGCGNKYDCWSHGDSVIALTTTTFDRSTGQILDADIELNASPATGGAAFVFTTADCPAGSTACLCAGGQTAACAHYDVQNTVTHEAGHSIGLDHSADPLATMFAFAPEGEEAKRALHPDDVDGVCAIYPSGEPTACDGGPAVGLVDAGGADAGSADAGGADAGGADAGRAAAPSGSGCASAPGARDASGSAPGVALALGFACAAQFGRRRWRR